VSPAAPAWVAALALTGAVFLLLPVRPPAAPRASPAAGRPVDGGRRSALLPWVVAGLAGAATAALLRGPVGLVAGVAAAVLAWRRLVRHEGAAARRERAAVAHDLPHLVGLLASVLRTGAAAEEAVRTVVAALPGPAADRLAAVPARLAVGLDPARVWADLADDPGLAPLGRALARSAASGAPVAAVVSRLADDLRDAARSRVEEQARAVGVRAAVPLGLCLLPSFLLLGIVPLVVGLLASLAW
jgi:pilus assembly protein TadC